MEDIYNKHFEETNNHDITLIAEIDNRKVSAHRFVLEEASDYFKSLLGPYFMEGEKSEICLENIDGETLKNVVKSCYLQEIEINENNLPKLSGAASMFLVTKLENKCTTFMLANLTATNCVQFYALVSLYNFEGSRDSCLQYIIDHFEDIESKQFFPLQFDVFAEIMSNEYIRAEEDSILKVIIEWTESDYDNRLPHLEELLETVNLQCVTGSFLSRVAKGFFMKANNQSKNVFNEIFRRIDISPTLMTHRRLPRRLIKVESSDGFLHAYKYTPRTKLWDLIREFTVCREYYLHVVIKHHLFSVFWFGCERFNFFHEYIQFSIWRDILHAQCCGNFLIIITDHAIYRVDTESDKAREKIKTFSAKPSYLQCCIVNEMLYVVHSGAFERIDVSIENCKWTELKKPVLDWTNAKLLVVKNTIYSIDFDDQIGLKFDIETNKWTGVLVTGMKIHEHECITAVNLKEKTLFMAQQSGNMYQVTQDANDRQLLVELVESNKSEVQGKKYYLVYSDEMTP